jgi:S-adenosylmethionine:tRNA ribosyltransferase-isomerase
MTKLHSANTIVSEIPKISIDDYTYDLPEERIAATPLAERDQSKLMMVDARTGAMSHHRFYNLPELLPPHTLLIRNNSKVIAARLLLRKQSGGRVEVLCAQPLEPSPELPAALLARGSTKWKCLLHGRNLKPLMSLSTSVVYNASPLLLKATLLEKNVETTVCFEWQPKELTFLEVLEAVGKVPLPPYLNREPDEQDKIRYQTVYAKNEGSVAAPTAGLHFTQAIYERLQQKGIDVQELTLHVGIGTFKPVHAHDARQHDMHAEQVIVSKQTLVALHQHLAQQMPVVAVGTTSLRVLESLYWFGMKLALKQEPVWRMNTMNLEQWEAYALLREHGMPQAHQSLEALLNWLDKHGLEAVTGSTQLMIVPGYHYKICDGLITNFHQPRSTLILLVAAFLGGDLWKKVYDEALQNEYRFLSYGDASLLWR